MLSNWVVIVVMATQSEFHPPLMIGSQINNGVYDVTRAVSSDEDSPAEDPAIFVRTGWRKIVSITTDATFPAVFSPLSLEPMTKRPIIEKQLSIVICKWTHKLLYMIPNLILWANEIMYYVRRSFISLLVVFIISNKVRVKDLAYSNGHLKKKCFKTQSDVK